MQQTPSASDRRCYSIKLYSRQQDMPTAKPTALRKRKRRLASSSSDEVPNKTTIQKAGLKKQATPSSAEESSASSSSSRFRPHLCPQPQIQKMMPRTSMLVHQPFLPPPLQNRNALVRPGPTGRLGPYRPTYLLRGSPIELRTKRLCGIGLDISGWRAWRTRFATI